MDCKKLTCEWCKKDFPHIPKKTVCWYGFKFCSIKCSNLWGESDRRPRTPERNDRYVSRFDTGGAC